MRLLKQLIVAILIISMLTIGVSASGYVADDNGRVTVSGTVDVSKISYDIYNSDDSTTTVIDDRFIKRTLTYMLLKPGYTADSLVGISDADLSDKALEGIGQVGIGDLGEYSIPVKISSKISGIYQLVAVNKFMDTMKFDIEYVYKIYRDFNEILLTDDIEQMRSFVESNAVELEYDSEGYNLLDSTSKNQLLNDLLASAPLTSNEQLKGLFESLNIRDRLFKTSTDAASLAGYLKNACENDDAQLTAPIFDVYADKLTAEQQKAAVTAFMGKGITTEAIDTFTFVILKEMASAFEYVRQYEAFILDEDNVWGISTDDKNAYNTSNKDKVCSEFKTAITSAANMSVLRTSLHTIILNNPYTAVQGGGITGGGSIGGGGSGGGGGKTTSTPIVDIDKDKNETATPPVVEADNKPQMKFTDIGGVKWAETAIEAMWRAGIINGISETLYSPDNSIKREEFVKLLMVGLRMTGIEATNEFTDVDEGDWFYPSVSAASRAGIIKGSDGKFGTGSNITRQDMAVMLARALEYKGKSLDKTRDIWFNDYAEVSDYALNAVELLAGSGIIQGNDAGGFEPLKTLTRAEAAVVLYNFLTIINLL